MEPNQSIEMRLVDAEGRSLHLGNVALELQFFVMVNFGMASK